MCFQIRDYEICKLVIGWAGIPSIVDKMCGYTTDIYKRGQTFSFIPIQSYPRAMESEKPVIANTSVANIGGIRLLCQHHLKRGLEVKRSNQIDSMAYLDEFCGGDVERGTQRKGIDIPW